MISVIMSVHNEGQEVIRTIDSLLRNTTDLCEILLVDDGSTDKSCAGLEEWGIQVIRHNRRRGIAYSRDHAARLATGDAVAFLDGHQRVAIGCLDRCARLACRESAIVSPDVRGFTRNSRILHGAAFRQCPDQGYFTARWRVKRPDSNPTRINSLRCPGYVMPRAVYEKVRWIKGMKNWGGSEAAISLKAFFLDIPILHLCGVMARHMFKKKLNYDATWNDVWRNHALIARVCFDDRTWYNYWLPEVFDSHLTAEARENLESPSIRDQHDAFMALKIRKDREFWTHLLGREVPAALR